MKGYKLKVTGRKSDMPCNEVPPETIIRRLSIENGKLKSEIDELKDKLERKDKAIAAFKKWQSKVAEYKWQYWLQEGILLMDTPPDNSILKKLFKLLEYNRIFNNWVKRVDNVLHDYEKVKNQFKESINK